MIYGAAKVTWNTNGIFYTRDPIEVSIDPQVFDISTDAHGVIDHRVSNHQVVVRCTPEGRITAGLFGTGAGTLWPYGNYAIGSSIFGITENHATDATLVIDSKDLKLHTLHNAAVTSMPTITLSTTKTVIGPVEFTGIRTNSGTWAADDTLYSVDEVGSAFVDSGFAVTDIKTQVYTGVWTAITGFTSISTYDGWTIEFSVDTVDVEVDDTGLIDRRISNVSAMARCIPVGSTPTVTQIAGQQKLQATAGYARGMTMGTNAADLVITGADATTVVTLKNASLKSAGYRFGSTTLRVGEIGFVTTRKLTAGAATDPIWTITPA